MSERLRRFEGLRDSVRTRMTDALAQELTVLWNRAAAAGAEPERLTAALETWRRRLQQMARDTAAVAGTPFVGRSRELGQLRDLLRQAGSGRAAKAVITGEAGVGKTRLLTEFAERSRQDHTVYVLSGSCVKPGAAGMPFAPLVESLRALLREQGPESVRRAAGPAWHEVADLVGGNAISSPHAVRPDVGVPGRLRVFSAVRRMLEHLGGTAPVLLVFEDLQWADQSTLDLVRYLAHTLSGERTLLACSHRSALPAGHRLRTMLAEPGFAARVTSVELRRFSEAELSTFLGGLAALGRDVVRRCHEVSGGNAFFAEQSVRSGVLPGVLSGRIEGHGKRYRDELVPARLRTLGPAARRVLRVASAGRRVDDRLLETVSGLDDDVLDDALQACLHDGMLAVDVIDGRYAMPHELLSSAVYKEMTPPERRRLHGDLAQALTAGAGSAPAQDWDVAVELAYHWYRARRYPEALAAALRAGEMTMLVRGFPEAVSHYRRALSLWDRVAEPEVAAHCSRDEVLFALAEAARWAGNPGQAAAHIQEAVESVGPHAGPRRLGELYERLGAYRREARLAPEDDHSYAEAVRLLSQAAPGETVLARALSGLAMSEVRAGSCDTALIHAQEAVVLAHDCDDAAAKNDALNAAGLALAVSGRTAESEPVLRRALDVADRADRLEDVLRTYRNLARTLEFAGDTAGSADQAQAGLRRARTLGLAGTRLGGALAGDAASSLMLLGRWNAATDLLNEALADHPHTEDSARLWLMLAGIEVEQGRFEDAERRIEELRQQRIGDPWLVAALHACEAELWCWRGEPVRAHGTASRGLEMADDVLMRLRLCAVGLRAAADHRSGRPDGDAVADGDLGADRALIDIAATDAARSPATAVVRLLLGQCEAEHRRAAAADSAEQWAVVAAGWDGVDRPYPAAYARWRQAAAGARAAESAGASGSAPVTPALQAVEAAARLGAEPLRAEAARLIEAMGTGVAGAGAGAGPGSGAGAVAVGSGTAAGGAVSLGELPELRIASLTPREADVLRLLATGCSNREIGRRFHLADGTVATHVHRIMLKLGARNRTEAALWAFRHGIGVKGE